MKIDVVVGDVLRTPADVLVSTANPWLNLSGGVNGAVREATGYGPLSIGDFAAAARPLLQEDNDQRDRRRWNLSVTVVVRNEDERDRLRGGWSVDRRDWS